MFGAVCQWGMVPDTVEYGQWKNGIRSEGIPIGFFCFTLKCGMAVGGALAAMVMSWTGYVANTELTGVARTAIIWLFNLVPAGFALACAITLCFYKLDGPKYKQILADLEARAGKKQAS